MDDDTMKRLVVRLLGVAERCDDAAVRTDLRLIAREISDTIDGGQSGERQQDH